MVGESARGADNLRGASGSRHSGATPPAVDAARGHCFDSPILRPLADAGISGYPPGEARRGGLHSAEADTRAGRTRPLRRLNSRAATRAVKPEGHCGAGLDHSFLRLLLYDEALGLLRGGGADGAEADLKVFLTNHSFSHLGLFTEHFRDGDKILRFTRSAR